MTRHDALRLDFTKHRPVPHVEMRLPATLLLILLPLAAAATAAGGPRASYRVATTLHTVASPQLFNGTAASAAALVAANLAAYDALLQTAAADAGGPADVIVFPESGTGYLMVPDGNATTRLFCEPVPPVGWAASAWRCPPAGGPATGHQPHANWASCAAQAFNLDVVINYCAWEQSPASGERHYYNANLVFEATTGTFLAVYRKSHINAVPTLTQPPVPDPTTYVSKKAGNVTFGLFICYDLWFMNPTQAEIDRLGARDFLYPNGMGSLPPAMAIDQAHAGWSLARGVNLASAGLFTDGGAGAFSRGTVVGLNPLFPQRQAVSNVIVSTLPHLHHSPADDATPRGTPSVEPSAAAVDLAEASLCPNGTAVANASVPCLGGTAACTELAGARPGGCFRLAAAFAGPFGTVECAAAVAVGDAAPRAHRWWLAAFQFDMVPESRGTPDASEHGFCLVMHCDAPDAPGCNFGAPANWASDLRVRAIAVRARFGGGFAARAAAGGIRLFPINSFLAAPWSPDGAAALPLRILPPPQFRATLAAVTGAVAANGTDTAGHLFSFGVYATAKGASRPA